MFAPVARGQAPEADPRPTSGRRIVGWLVTFDRSPEGTSHILREGQNRLGRDRASCDIVVEGDDMVTAGGHAVIRWRGGKTRLSDNNSTNGTFLNEADIEDLPGPVDLKTGDVIRIGRTRFICQLLDHDQFTALWKS